MVVLLQSVYLSAVTCIYVEISLGSCWRKDILGSKVNPKMTKSTFLRVCATVCGYVSELCPNQFPPQMKHMVACVVIESQKQNGIPNGTMTFKL